MKLYGTLPSHVYVLHHCDVPNCKQIKHIWTGTQSDNMKDCAKKGRSVFQKERSKEWKNKTASLGTRKLTDEDVKAIRRFSSISKFDWARGFEVTIKCIEDVKNGKSFKGINP